MSLAATVRIVLVTLLLAATAGCATRPPGPPPMASRDEVQALAEALKGLGDAVDPAEAERLAEIAYEHTHELAIQYQIEDPPLIHNMKVNMGLKPRGLCKDWADDMETRLRQEDFQSLSLHRAIANHDKAFRIEHSTVIVSARGADMYEGIVIDPWRLGGVLWWGKVTEDPDYDWAPREEVFAYKRRLMEHDAVMAARNGS
ncbi:MAG: hypothetical protein D6811_09355 [Alphaproteobacteria bacterium]|nr:MAG: hypothetical protein D6811_09355 [Alphaproteobacteria bacterium]